ncbi:MAG: septum formation inhibitor Maf [Clostridia bacterium]|nr:septum formation inhibitor Maf [Clostridia bacterium]
MIILASNSPRRRELLQMAGYKFMVSASHCNETSKFTDPENMTMEIAMKKAYATFYSEKDDIIIGADTVVVCDGKALGKPQDKEQAADMLRILSGKTHSVYTGVCLLRNGESECFCSKTDVTFYQLDESTIDWYVNTNEPMDKAGAYGIQGKGALLVEKINGDYYNVVGLPIAKLNRKLKELLEDK